MIQEKINVSTIKSSQISKQSEPKSIPIIVLLQYFINPLALQAYYSDIFKYFFKKGGEYMQTLFESKKDTRETVSLDEINNQHVSVLPKREELSVINYNIGYPYGGYDGYHASYNAPNHQVDTHHANPDYRFDCYRIDSSHENIRYDHDYWKQYEGANDKNIPYNRHDNGLHLGQYKNDGYAPYVAYNTYYSAPPTYGYEHQPVNTYSGYNGYTSYPTYGYSGTPYGSMYSPYNGYYRA